MKQESLNNLPNSETVIRSVKNQLVGDGFIESYLPCS